MLANSFVMFYHRISCAFPEALGSLNGQNQNNGLNLVWAPDISSKHCDVPIDSLVLKTIVTWQGLRLDKGIEPALVRCMPTTAFCQKNSHCCSTTTNSKSKNTTEVTNPVFPGC